MKRPDEPTSCQHCGALTFPDARQCSRCGRFPIKLHQCPICRTIAGIEEEHCPKCGRMFEPGGDIFS